MRKAIIDAQGLVLNIIEIEPDSTWSAPTGTSLIDAGDGSPGDTWDGEEFVKPILSEPEPVRGVFAEIDELKARVEALEVIK